MSYSKDDILGYECKHAVYCHPPKGERHDYHFVKEQIHLKDGRIIPNVRMIKDYKRSFWITKEGCRNHTQKKEREYLDRLIRYESTQSKLLQSVATALGKPWFKGTMRELADSPYLYGTDIFSTTLIKGEYNKKWPDLVTPSTVACFDTETSMKNGSIIMATLSFKDRAYTAVRRDFFNGYANAEMRVKEAFDKHLDRFKKDRNIKWEFAIVDTEIDIIISTFNRAHEWKPDFLSVWNINFDLPKVLEACKRAKIDPKNIFSDPKVPPAYRHFYYKEGRKIKVMASGKEMPIGVADQWHTVYCPSSFYFIDAMCVYRKLRVQRGEQPSYSLDYVLGTELGERKLKFSEADEYTGGEWHEFMQDNYRSEYVTYNVFDCIGMELLDEKIKDLSLDLPLSCITSDFESFGSLPKRAVDELHYYLLDEQNSVIGSTGKNMRTELDKLPSPNTDLIVNLKSYLLKENGLRCIKDIPSLVTKIRRKNYDLD